MRHKSNMYTRVTASSNSKKGATLGSPEAAPLSSRYYFLNVFQIMARFFNSLRALQTTEGLFFNFFMQQKWSVNF